MTRPPSTRTRSPTRIPSSESCSNTESRPSRERYRITVRSRDGRDSVFEQDSLEGIRVGDRVRVDGGRVIRD